MGQVLRDNELSIRTYNLIVLCVTLVAGMALAGVYAWTASAREGAIYQVNRLELAEERLAAFEQRLDVVLTAADLAVGSGESYSASWAREETLSLKAKVMSFERQAALLSQHIDTQALAPALQALADAIDVNDMRSEDNIKTFDQNASRVIRLVVSAKESLTESTASQRDVIESISLRSVWAQVTSAILFIAMSVLLSLFGVRAIVRPLESIQCASASEDSEALSHEEYLRAPTEIRDLASVLRQHIRNLNQTVALRTRELSYQTEELKKEINRRSSAEKEMSEALRKAEEASAAKSDFLSVTSHELRTPLNTVAAALALIKTDRLSNAEINYLGLAIEATQNLEILLRDILDFAANDISGVKIVRKPTDLALFFQSIIDHSFLVADAQGVVLQADICEDMLATGLIDAKRVRQVIDNLISNALKYGEGAPVSLRIDTDNSSDGDLIIVSIKDKGPGISEEQLENIFDPFVQVDSSLSRQTTGVGLGLALCKTLAMAMGGNCTVTSALGEGADFEFMFPVPSSILPALGDTETVEGDRPQHLSADILLVEDSEVNQLLAQKMLESYGLNVTLASNGLQACELCLRAKFHVVLMDLQMPGMDGFDTTRRIKMLEGPNRTTPVLALTANIGEPFLREAREAGMVGLLEKPMDMQKVITAISDLL